MQAGAVQTGRFGGSLGELRDPRSGRDTHAQWFGEVTVRCADPAKLAAAAGGDSSGARINQIVNAALLGAARETAAAGAQATGSFAILGDPSRASNVMNELAPRVARALAGAGLELVQINASTFLVSVPPTPAPPPSPQRERTYEMLWDCKHCGHRKNLGLTHRHCPNCGAEQDAKARYFPSESEKVAVEDHEYVGADLQCRYCQAYASRKAHNCGSCGAPLEGATEAARHIDPALAAPRAPAPVASTTRKRAKWPFVVGAGLLAVLSAGAVAIFWEREGTVEVASHSWSREIRVENFAPRRETAWCDSMPTGATNVDRTREVRSHEQVADGEECSTHRVDNGDGTFREEQQCRTKYRSKPIYDWKCRYTVHRWALLRTERATGSNLMEAPTWPTVHLARTGECVGCEREGARSESYTVHLTEPSSGEKFTCDFDQSKWQSLAMGSSWKAQIAVVGDRLDCDDLVAIQ